MVAVLNNFISRSSRVALAALVAVTMVSCASSSGGGSIKVARNAEMTQNYDIAVAEYTKLVRANPNDREARQGLERAKLRASQDHFTTARRLAATGKLEEALVEFQLASELNPGNAGHRSRAEGDAQPAPRQDRGPRRGGKTRLESLIAQSLVRSPAGLRSAGGCQAARLGGVPRRQRPRHLLGDRQVHEPQRRCSIRRSAISRSRSTCAARRSKRR